MEVEYFDVPSQREDEYVCQLCGELYVDADPEHDSIDRRNHDCQAPDDIVTSFVPGAFGLVVPQASSDFVFETQTNGHLCEQRRLRGTYIPISSNPIVSKREVDPRNLQRPDEAAEGPFYELLRQAQYADIAVRKNNPRQKRDEVWRLIDEQLPFVYEDAEAPRGYPESVPAWKWVRILSGQNSSSKYEFVDVDALSGKTVVLVYPNFD